MAKTYSITAISRFDDIKALAEEYSQNTNVYSIDISKVRIRGMIGTTALDQSQEHAYLTIIVDDNNYDHIFEYIKSIFDRPNGGIVYSKSLSTMQYSPIEPPQEKSKI